MSPDRRGALRPRCPHALPQCLLCFRRLLGDAGESKLRRRADWSVMARSVGIGSNATQTGKNSEFRLPSSGRSQASTSPQCRACAGFHPHSRRPRFPAPAHPRRRNVMLQCSRARQPERAAPAPVRRFALATATPCGQTHSSLVGDARWLRVR